MHLYVHGDKKPGLMEANPFCRLSGSCPGRVPVGSGAAGGCSAARGALGGDRATSATGTSAVVFPDVLGEILTL